MKKNLIKNILLFLLLMVGIQMALASPQISQNEYKKSCEEMDAEGCVELGDLYYEGKKVELDYSKAAKLFKKACGIGSARGCSLLGYSYKKGKGVSQDHFKAQELYLKACNKGYANGCYNAGNAYFRGDVVKKDYIKAADQYQKACDLGAEYACVRLGAMYKEGKGIKQDYFKAAELFQIACVKKDARGCSKLGVLYRKGLGVKKDYDKARQFFQKSSDLGGAKGHFYLGLIYYNGEGGVSVNRERAKTLFKKACDKGQKPGCKNYMELVDDRFPSYLKLSEQFQIACDNDDATGCLKLGHMYKKGLGGKQDNTKAMYYFQKASDLELAIGHFYLGLMYTEKGINKNMQRAKVLFKKACDKGESIGCEKLHDID